MPIEVSAVTGRGGPRGRREGRRFLVAVVVVCCWVVGVVTLTGCGGSSRHAASASVHPGAVVGQKVTLTLGEEGTAVGLDDEEPNEEFETGVEGEKPPPTDTPYRPTEAETAAAPRTASGSRAAAASVFGVFRSTPTKGNGGTAVSEPTAANDANVILATGNTWAMLSNDDGLTWPSSLSLNPASNPPPGDKVCCDQVTYSVDRTGHRMTFWLIQNDCGGTRCGGNNPRHQNALTLRMFADQADLLAGQVCDFTLSPSAFGLSKDFFDFNKVSSTSKYLYVVTDVRTLTHKSDGAEIIRLPLDDLDSGDCKTSFSGMNVKGQDSLAPVENAGSTMFLAAHVHDLIQGDQLRIYSIPDSSTTLSHVDRNVNNYGPNNRGKGSCKSPDGDDPCKRFNDNQTVGFHSGSSVGWMWTAPQDHEFPFPQVRVAVFDTASQKLVTEHTIWNRNFAWTYPAVGVNTRGELGVIVYAMGGGSFPSPSGFIRTNPRNWSGITLHSLVKGVASFKTNTWGDYASVHRYTGCPNTFLGTAWSIQRSAAGNVAENRSVWFGNPADSCADMAVTAALALPTKLKPGDTLSIIHVTKNLGAAATATTTRYYLSKDSVKSSADILLINASAEPALVAGGQFAPTTVLAAVIPTMPAGTYKLIACANDKNPIAETTTANNCFTPAETLTISPK